MRTFQLKLYVTGTTRRTELAIANLRSLLDKEVDEGYDLVVYDVLQDPEVAEAQKILATPTLVKEFPLPVRRIIGDFSDAEKVLFALDIQPRKGGHDDDK